MLAPTSGIGFSVSRDKRRCSAALGMTSAASSLTSPNMRASHLEDFYQFLRFPSVSTDDQYAEKVTEGGHWLVENLTKIGLSAKLCPNPGHPGVWAKTEQNPGGRTALHIGPS